MKNKRYDFTIVTDKNEQFMGTDQSIWEILEDIKNTICATNAKKTTIIINLKK